MANGGEVIFKFLGDDKGLNKTLEGIKGIGVGAMKALGTATVAATAAFTALVAASVKARGEVEQSIGGIETIFKENADMVIENAKNAYKTAGVSANEYMQGVASFSASLLQSTGNDTKKAAEIADMAFRDMSDNANKFGTDMASIQNAYQGFAKQNYTMLDNLKLGYGGTKKEMERLLKDAQKLTGVKYDINNLSDVYEAIHAIQELGPIKITGTTEEEATKTLLGSLNMLQAAWQNFLGGTGGLGEVTEAATYAFENILRMVNDAIPDIMNSLTQHMPELINLIVSAGSQVAQAIFENIPLLMTTLGQVFNSLLDTFIQYLPQILDGGIEIILSLADGITQGIPTLIPKVVEIVMTIVNKLIEHLPDILEAAFKLWLEIMKALVKAAPQIMAELVKLLWNLLNAIAESYQRFKDKGKELLTKIGDGIKDGVSYAVNKVKEAVQKIFDAIKQKFQEIINSAKQWGKDMIEGFANGIQERLGSLQSHVDSVTNSIRSRLHFSRPDEGPLRDYETWMPDMIEGLAKSLDKASPLLLSKVHALSSEMAMSMSPSLNGNVNNSLSPSFNVIVNNNIEQDPLGQMVSQIKTFSNGAKNDYNYGYGG
jgi:phage-related protein